MTTATTEALPYQEAALRAAVALWRAFGADEQVSVIREAMQTAHREGMLAAAKIARDEYNCAGFWNSMYVAAGERIAEAIEAAANRTT